MSREHVQVAQRAFAAFQGGDLDGFLALVDPEAVWQPLAHEVEGPGHGHDGVRRWWAGLAAVFPDLEPTIDEIRDLGDVVLIHLLGGGRGAESGVGIELDLWQIVEPRDGLIVWYCALRTEQEALEAVRARG